MPAHTLKERLYSNGAIHVERYFPEYPNCYICPLCFSVYDNHKYLTLEHVPPKFFGGNIMCLTCVSCNSNTGSISEGHMHRETESSRFLNDDNKWRRGTVKIDELTLNVAFRRSENRIEVDGMPKNNNPAVHSAFFRQLDEKLDKIEFQATSGVSFNPNLAAFGYLKSAYLSIFCKLGYAYVFHSALRNVRRQILNPELELLPEFRLKLGGKDLKSKTILLVRNPINALIVQFGSIAIPLPSYTATDDSIYQFLSGIADKMITSDIDFEEWSWPNKMEMQLDKHYARDA